MNIQYFPDTDILYIRLTDRDIVDTRSLTEKKIIELDKDGNLVAMTLERPLEHAKKMAKMSQFPSQ